MSAAKGAIQAAADVGKIYQMRMRTGEGQATFWRRFGVSQSAGARYESIQTIPTPTAVLIMLWLSGKVTDSDLERARQACGRSTTPLTCCNPWGPVGSDFY